MTEIESVFENSAKERNKKYMQMFFDTARGFQEKISKEVAYEGAKDAWDYFQSLVQDGIDELEAFTEVNRELFKNMGGFNPHTKAATPRQIADKCIKESIQEDKMSSTYNRDYFNFLKTGKLMGGHVIEWHRIGEIGMVNPGRRKEIAGRVYNEKLQEHRYKELINLMQNKDTLRLERLAKHGVTPEGVYVVLKERKEENKTDSYPFIECMNV